MLDSHLGMDKCPGCHMTHLEDKQCMQLEHAICRHKIYARGFAPPCSANVSACCLLLPADSVESS